jgi:hypothetical protein
MSEWHEKIPDTVSDGVKNHIERALLNAVVEETVFKNERKRVYVTAAMMPTLARIGSGLLRRVHKDPDEYSYTTKSVALYTQAYNEYVMHNPEWPAGIFLKFWHLNISVKPGPMILDASLTRFEVDLTPENQYFFINTYSNVLSGPDFYAANCGCWVTSWDQHPWCPAHVAAAKLEDCTVRPNFNCVFCAQMTEQQVKSRRRRYEMMQAEVVKLQQQGKEINLDRGKKLSVFYPYQPIADLGEPRAMGLKQGNPAWMEDKFGFIKPATIVPYYWTIKFYIYKTEVLKEDVTVFIDGQYEDLVKIAKTRLGPTRAKTRSKPDRVAAASETLAKLPPVKRQRIKTVSKEPNDLVRTVVDWSNMIECLDGLNTNDSTECTFDYEAAAQVVKDNLAEAQVIRTPTPTTAVGSKRARNRITRERVLIRSDDSVRRALNENLALMAKNKGLYNPALWDKMPCDYKMFDYEGVPLYPERAAEDTNRRHPGPYDLILSTQREMMHIDSYMRVLLKFQEQNNTLTETVEKIIGTSTSRTVNALRPLIKALSFNSEISQACLTRAAAITLVVRRRDNAVRAYGTKYRKNMHAAMYHKFKRKLSSSRLVRGQKITKLTQAERNRSKVKRARQTVDSPKKQGQNQGSDETESDEPEECVERTDSESESS